MLSIGRLSTVSATVRYYQNEGGYSPGEDNSGLWFGRAAQEMGLEGRLKENDFSAILNGQLPNNLVMIANYKKRNLGFDLTFSAPKTVSIMLQVAGDKRIGKLHEKAVNTALQYVEDNLLQTQVKGDVVNKMAAALFHHDMSRNQDPQLHTHCVVANVTHGGGDKWRSVNFKKVFDNQLLVGAIYRSCLAYELSKIGYKVEVTHSDGRFEIMGVPKELVERFSSRTKEIKQALENYNFQNPKTAENAALRTRGSKQKSSRQEIQQNWQNIVAEQKVDLKALCKDAAKSPAEGNFLLKSKDNIICSLKKMVNSFADYSYKGILATKAIEYASLHLGERSASFHMKDMYRNAMAYSLGRVEFSTLERAANSLFKTGYLIRREKGLMTTGYAVNLERNMIKMMKEGKLATQSIMNESNLSAKLVNMGLNQGQAQALEMVLTTKQQVVGIQGYAGVGKTYMMKKLNTQVNVNGWQITGLAPTVNAAGLLYKETGIKSQTLHSFLLQYQDIVENRVSEAAMYRYRQASIRKIILVDESSMAASSHIFGVLKIARHIGSKVVLMGDSKQIGAVEAGKPFAQLLENGMRHVVMDNIVRQSNPELRMAVYAARDGRINRSLHKLADNVKQTKTPAIKAAYHWLALSADDKKQYLVLAPSHRMRKQINDVIRMRLKLEGALTGEIVKHNVYVSKNLTRVQSLRAINFQNGDIVMFNNMGSASGHEEKYKQVAESNHKNNIIGLKNSKQDLMHWNPNKGKGDYIMGHEVFTQESIELQKGDLLRFTRNFKSAGIINGKLVTVDNITEQGVSLIDKEGNKMLLQLDSQELKHMDYAYAVTVHAAQGKTINNVIAAMSAHEKLLTNQQLFYVTISRAKEQVFLYVDDKQAFKDNLIKVTGEKLSAIKDNMHELTMPVKTQDSFLQDLLAKIDFKENKISKLFDDYMQNKEAVYNKDNSL